MTYRPGPPHPKNTPGPFYVEHGHCITCGAPETEAPDLMAHDGDGGYPHCYFRRQPSTPEELARAIDACVVSCCGAVRYAGADPEVLRRFIERGCEDACDALSATGPEPSQPGLTPARAWSAQPPPSIHPAVDRAHPLFDRELDG